MSAAGEHGFPSSCTQMLELLPLDVDVKVLGIAVGIVGGPMDQCLFRGCHMDTWK